MKRTIGRWGDAEIGKSGKIPSLFRRFVSVKVDKTEQIEITV